MRTLTIPGRESPIRVTVAADPAEIDDEVERTTALALRGTGATVAPWMRCLELEVEPGAIFPGDSDDLDEIVGNLAENACK